MNAINRRDCLKQFALVLAAKTLPAVFRPGQAFAASVGLPPLSESTISDLNEIARQFLDRFKIPALSVAIARYGQMVYREGFGFADTAKRERTTPSHLFRIASVSKPVTSVAVFSLIEQGKLGLDDFVFGERGVLKSDYGSSDSGYLKDITVRHLLTHTCGGWENSKHDPMFANPAMNHTQLIEWTLKTCPLTHEPGTHYDYSNFGYCLLGRIVEKISGRSYAEFVQQSVLAKCGITTMRIAGNTLADRAQGEVMYYGQNDEHPYRMNISRMDSHGGWIATATDLVQFVNHVDGFKTTPNILREDTIRIMTTPGKAKPDYACGWCVNKAPNWWHAGGMPGTASILVRTASGWCWAALVNSRPNDGLAIDQMMWNMVKAVPAWQT